MYFHLIAALPGYNGQTWYYLIGTHDPFLHGTPSWVSGAVTAYFPYPIDDDPEELLKIKETNDFLYRPKEKDCTTTSICEWPSSKY